MKGIMLMDFGMDMEKNIIAEYWFLVAHLNPEKDGMVKDMIIKEKNYTN